MSSSTQRARSSSPSQLGQNVRSATPPPLAICRTTSSRMEKDTATEGRACSARAPGGVAKAVKMARQYASFVRKIEVEVETLEQVKEAVEAGADIIMLDNMSDEDMRKAVTLIAGRAKTECSGNVTRENIARLRDIGIDYVSSGALTHSAPILDLSMKHLRPLTAEEA